VFIRGSKSYGGKAEERCTELGGSRVYPKGAAGMPVNRQDAKVRRRTTKGTFESQQSACIAGGLGHRRTISSIGRRKRLKRLKKNDSIEEEVSRPARRGGLKGRLTSIHGERGVLTKPGHKNLKLANDDKTQMLLPGRQAVRGEVEA